MTRKPKGPPPKGQRSIASFVFTKNTDEDQIQNKQNQTATATAEASKTPQVTAEPAANHTSLSIPPPPPPQVGTTTTVDDDVSPPPLKKPKSQPPPAHGDNTTNITKNTTTNKIHSHERWQSKLLGNTDTAGMHHPETHPTPRSNNIRTQSGYAPSAEKQKQPTQSQKFTPLETQVAALQRAHPDCILVIEVGYKYRFFGKDAEIASQVLGIFSYPDRNFLTASIPVFNIDKHVRRLTEAGHKVGVVRQTESAAIKAASDNRNKPFERTLTAVYTRATIEGGELAAAKVTGGGGGGRGGSGFHQGADDEEGNEEGEPASGGMRDAFQSNFLVCVVETPHQPQQQEIGVVAIEISTGEVLYSQFTDTPMRPELEARLMMAPPSEVLMVGALSSPTRRLLESYCSGSGSIGDVRIERILGAGDTKYGDGGALSMLTDFYSSSPTSGTTSTASMQTKVGIETKHGWKEECLDRLLTLPPLVVTALAHAVDHLKPFKLEHVLRQGATFREYSQVYEMSLSPNALSQLEILQNALDGGEKGSLVWLMDRTLTAAGSRLLRRWVSRPLRDVDAIEERLDAVEALLHVCGSSTTAGGGLASLASVLKSLPKDMERILGRVLHGTSSPPEFILFLQAFTDLYQRLGLEQDFTTPTTTTKATTTTATSCLVATQLALAGEYRCAQAAQSILSSLDANAASRGDLLSIFTDPEEFPTVEARRKEVVAAEVALEGLRPAMAVALHVRSVAYVTVANQGEYLVEVPLELEKRAPKTWERVSSTKKWVRYRPPEVKAGLKRLDLAKEHLAIAARAAWTELQAQFSESYYPLFRAAISALATLDCLHSLAAVAAAGGYSRPTLVRTTSTTTATTTSQIDVVDGRHPVLDVLMGPGQFVPNDLHMSSPAHPCLVITGPNMGGKSCFIRQAALLSIMAQVGSFVPATFLSLTPFDQIFTRMGAADNLALGRSTFLEELGETSVILQHATPRSLVIIDELGRGTSTRDGMAIASATLEYIATKVKCLTLFVTHYPEVAASAVSISLPPGSRGVPVVDHVYMDHVVVEDEGTTGSSTTNSMPAKVTFLYKAVKGVAAPSYGLNVARMAGVPEGVVRRAAEQVKRVDSRRGDGVGVGGVGGLLRSVVAELGEKGVDVQRVQEMVRTSMHV